MDHAATMRRMYELISAGDIDGFGDLVAEDFVEHEETPGLEPNKEGVKQLFRMYRAAFPTCGWRRRTSSSAVTRSSRAFAGRERTRASSWACPPPARASTSS